MRKNSYHPDIDGLRAVAIIGVILIHADIGLPGGQHLIEHGAQIITPLLLEVMSKVKHHPLEELKAEVQNFTTSY